MSGPIRSIATWVVGVLAVVALTASTVAVWARTTVADGARFGEVATDVLDDPAVQAALADRIAAEVVSAINLDQLLDDLFDGPLARLDRLQPTITAGVQSALATRLERVLDSQRVQELVGTLVERAHARAIDLLRGDGLIDGVTVSDGAVTLNLLPLLGLAFGEVQQLGLLQNVELPELTRDGDPDEQIAALSDALGRDLRPGFGQVVVYRGDQVARATEALDQAQRAVAIGLRALWLLLALTVVLVAATLLLARERWHALLALSLAVVAMMVLLRTVVHRVVAEAPDVASRPAGASTIAIVLDDLTDGLLRLCAVLIVIGVVCVVLSILRRQRQRRDLELAAAVAVGILVVALLGISIVSLLLGIVAAIATLVISRRFIGGPRGPGEEAHDEPIVLEAGAGGAANSAT